MRTYSASFRGWEWVMLLAPVPGIVVILALVLVEGIPVLTMLAIAVIAYGVLVAGVMEARRQARTAVQEEPELELLQHMPISGYNATVTVASTSGVCPLGFRSGYSWGIDADGKLSQPLCRPAVNGLVMALEGARSDDRTPFSCNCPLVRGDVEFALQRGAERLASVN
ncbi:MAG: hypothetical protein HY532_00670 [Chloroflexi bacterium]|nr:hypothetical protein [Chloroflexota bacterium]